MSNNNCITSIPFSIAGDLTYTDSDIDLAFVFNNQGDQGSVLAFEWYLDGVLVADQAVIGFSGSVPCGQHAVSGRILTSEGWSGLQEVTIKTCFTIISVIITGADTVLEGNNYNYSVMATYTDGSIEDLTSDYTFTASEGTFSGNTYTVANDPDSVGDRNATISAAKSGAQTLTKTLLVRHLWSNSAKSQSFNKNNCPDGSGGSAVTYSIPAGTYTSFISQADADQQAAADLAANGQNNANQYGSCLVPATVNYTLTEQPDPYVDTNMQIRDQGVVVEDLFSTTSGSFNLAAGHQLSVMAYTVIAPTAPDSMFTLIVKKNGIIVFNQSIPAESLADHPDAYLLYTDVASASDVYDLLTYSFSAATVNYTLTQQAAPDPYADVNLQINSNGVDILDVYNNETGSLAIGANNSIDFIAYAGSGTQGADPMIYLTVKRNGVVIYDQSHTGNSGDSLTFTEIAQANALYEVTVRSTAETAGQSPYSYTRSETFIKNNCQSGFGTAVIYNKAYYSDLSIADAQSKAAGDTTFEPEGQSFANNTGTCATMIGTVIQENATLLPFYWAGIGHYGNHYRYNLRIDLIADGYPAYSLITPSISPAQITQFSSINYAPDTDPPIPGAFLIASSWNSAAVPDTLPDGSDGFSGVRYGTVFLNLQKTLTDYPTVNHIIFEITLLGANTSLVERVIRFGGTYDKTQQDSGYFSHFLPEGDASGEIGDGLANIDEQSFKLRIHIYKLSANSGTLTYEVIPN